MHWQSFGYALFCLKLLWFNTPCCCRAMLRCAVLSVLLLLSEAEVVPVRQIDNSAVLAAQLARLASVKQSRDDDAVAAALQVGQSHNWLLATCVQPLYSLCTAEPLYSLCTACVQPVTRCMIHGDRPSVM